MRIFTIIPSVFIPICDINLPSLVCMSVLQVQLAKLAQCKFCLWVYVCAPTADFPFCH